MIGNINKLRESQQMCNAKVKELRAMQDEEAPDRIKVENLEKEIRGLLSTIETEKALLRAEADPEKRNIFGREVAPEDDETRAAILNYMRTGDRAHLRDMTSGTTSGSDTGGYLIPQSWEAQIIEKEKELFVMRQIADVQVSELDKHIPVADDYGVSTWVSEGAAYSESDPSLSEKIMTAWKVGRICKVSEELLQDNSYNLDQWLVNTFAYTNGLAMETAFIKGDGASKPRGFIIDADTVDAAGASLTYDDLLAMFASLKAGYYSRASWMMNVSTLAAIMKLKDDAGSYIYQPFQPKTATDPVGQILGKPIVLSELMDDIGTGAKPIALGDFKRYRIHDRTGFGLQRLNELYSGNGFIGFKGTQRTDGKLLIPEAVKVLTFA